MSAPLKTHWHYPRHLHITGKYDKESCAFLECQLQARLATKGYLKWHCRPPYSQLNPIPIQLSQPNSLERLDAGDTPCLLPQPAALLPVKHCCQNFCWAGMAGLWESISWWGVVQGRPLMLTVAFDRGTLKEVNGVLLSTLQYGKEGPQKQVSNMWNPLEPTGWKITLVI